MWRNFKKSAPQPPPARLARGICSALNGLKIQDCRFLQGNEEAGEKAFEVSAARDAAEGTADMGEFVVQAVGVAMEAEQRLIGFDQSSDRRAAGGAERICPISLSLGAVEAGGLGEDIIERRRLNIEDVGVDIVQFAHLVL